MTKTSGSEKRLIWPSKHTRRENKQTGNNSPVDEESAEGRVLYAPNKEEKEAEKNHALSSSEGGSSGNLAAARMRAGPASG